MKLTFKTPLQIARDVENQAYTTVMYEITQRDLRIKELEDFILALDKCLPIEVIIKAFSKESELNALQIYTETIVDRITKEDNEKTSKHTENT